MKIKSSYANYKQKEFTLEIAFHFKREKQTEEDWDIVPAIVRPHLVTLVVEVVRFTDDDGFRIPLIDPEIHYVEQEDFEFKCALRCFERFLSGGTPDYGELTCESIKIARPVVKVRLDRTPEHLHGLIREVFTKHPHITT